MIVHTMCRFCPNTCHVDADVQAGRLISVKRKAVPGIPVRRYCPKNGAAPHIVYAPDRITSPLIKRESGEEKEYQQASWDAALSHIAERLMAYKSEFGPESVAWLKGTGEDWGPVWQYAQRLMHSFGSPNTIGNGSLCHATRSLPHMLTYGSATMPDFLNAECIIVWGRNDKTSSPPSYERLIEGVKRGAKLVVVDPVQTDMAVAADHWLQIKPGCDGILAMAMMQVIISEKLYDERFVENWTIGFEHLTEAVRTYVPENVADALQLSPKEIRQVARMYARAEAACIADGNGLDMNADVTTNARAICMLRALCGNLDIPGGDIFPQQIPLRDMTMKEALGPNVKPVTTAYPLFNSFSKGGGDPVSTVLTDAILEERPYPIKALVIQASNPLVTAAHSGRVLEALEKVEFLVVIDMFMTRTAELADVFLPATTSFEKTQLNIAGLNASSIFVQEKAIDPVGDSRPDWQIIFDLAGALQLQDRFPFQSVEEAIDHQLQPIGVTVEHLREFPEGFVYKEPKVRKYLQDGFATPSGKVEFHSERLGDYGYEPIPSFDLTRAGAITFADAAQRFPLIAVSGEKSGWFVHARYRNIPWLLEKEPEPFVDLHPDDAAERGIREHEKVNVMSPNGEIVMRARLSEVVRSGMIRVPWGWGDHFPECSINLLTDDAVRDVVSSTPSVRTFMCEVEKVDVAGEG